MIWPTDGSAPWTRTRYCQPGPYREPASTASGAPTTCESATSNAPAAGRATIASATAVSAPARAVSVAEPIALPLASSPETDTTDGLELSIVASAEVRRPAASV